MKMTDKHWNMLRQSIDTELRAAFDAILSGGSVQAFDILRRDAGLHNGHMLTSADAAAPVASLFLAAPPAAAVLRGTVEGLGRANEVVMRQQTEALYRTPEIIKPS